MGRAPGTSRGRARLGKETNPERELPGAAAGFLPARKTEAVRGPAHGTNRVRARLGKATNTVRELLGAAAQAKKFCETLREKA